MPRPVVQHAPPAVVVVEQQPIPATIATPLPAAPTPPQFPYRYIGRFGPAHDPIAAFAGEGNVRTVRAGDRIDERFRLRAINLETVQVEARDWPEKIVVGLSTAM